MSETVGPSSIESVWRDIRIELEREKERIYDAIRNYPPPITACDEQFDQLLERRDRISRQLARLWEVSPARLTPDEAAARIDEFIGSATHLSAAARQRITAALRPTPRHGKSVGGKPRDA